MATRPTGFDQTAQPAKRPAPFWHRLNTFFTFPLQSKPLMYSLILALSSMLFKVIFFLPDALGILIVEIGILLAASRYGFKITALGSRGIYNADDYPAELDPDWKNLPWKLFAIVIAQSMVVGWLQSVSPTLGTLAWLVILELSVYLSALSWITAAPSRPMARTSTATSTSISVMPIWCREKTWGKPLLGQASITVVIRVEVRKKQEKSAVRPKTSAGFSLALLPEQREILWT